MSLPRRIVLTGGPCGGKSTLIRELHACDSLPVPWVEVPEAVLPLLDAGLEILTWNFQKAVVRVQFAFEDACFIAAPTDSVVLCHRGALDPLAYWIFNGWKASDFFSFTETTRDELYARYYAVIHLQSVAIDARHCYNRSKGTNRRETPEEAAQLDKNCAEVWGDHPRFFQVTNKGIDWTRKAAIARQYLTTCARELKGRVEDGPIDQEGGK